jgi:antimicrobial peptide system SdpB family protein
VEGGEHISNNLSLFLIPICLFDGNPWHWNLGANHKNQHFKGITEGVFATLCRIQVCIVYLHAGVAKIGLPDWDGGTVIYYYSLHPTFGLSPFWKPILAPLFRNPGVSFFLSWSVMILELTLAAGLFAKKEIKNILFWLGAFFHLGIYIVYGLSSFATIMFAALIILLMNEYYIQIPKNGRQILVPRDRIET